MVGSLLAHSTDVRGRFFLIFSMLATQLHAGTTPPWTPGQIALATVTGAEILVDWGQTRDALSRGHEEMNPVLGPHPSPERLAAYNAVVISGMVAVGAMLSPRWRTVWFAGLAVLQTITVTRNAALGFRVRF